MTAPEDILERAYRLIAGRIGHIVPDLYAERVLEGVRRAETVLGTRSPDSALTQLTALPIESRAWQALIQSIAVGETNFLRHREWFAEITSRVLEPLIAERLRHGPRRIDLWSAGCSTGEEAYTLALIVNRLLPDSEDFTVRIVATDINEASLHHAREAVYRRWSIRELDPIAVSDAFTPHRGDRVQLKPHLRRMVEFKVLNLCSDDYPNTNSGFFGFDLVICRNVLIYLSSEEQLAVASRLTRTLGAGGWLAVSPAEATADWYKPLRLVNSASAILFHNAGPTCRKIATARHKTKAPAPASEFSAPVAAAKLRAKAGQMRRPHAPPSRSIPAAAPTPGPSISCPIKNARGLADRGAYVEARQACEKHIAHGGPHFGAYLLLATVSLESGELNGAFEAARCAAYLDPDSAAAHYVLATIHHRMGAPELAARKMAVVVKLLQPLADDEQVSEHFGATVGELRASARAYLSERIVA